jgi:hypothetical protein
MYSAHIYGTSVPVKEPSTASKAEFGSPWSKIIFQTHG